MAFMNCFTIVMGKLFKGKDVVFYCGQPVVERLSLLVDDHKYDITVQL